MPQPPRQVTDLTKPLNEDTEIYQDESYSDPGFAVRTWSEVASRGFWVSSVEMGTQTGTHIDAPAHFVDGGQTLEALDLGHLIGPYFRISPDDIGDPARRKRSLARYDGEPILFLVAGADRVQLPEDAVADLISLGCKVWAVAGAIEITGQPPLSFHRVLAQNGIYLIEELDDAAARAAPPRGHMVALPLRLERVSGSPCRVVVLNEEVQSRHGHAR